MKPRVIVVGAGALGGWTALHLQRLGAEVTLFDRWGPGNSRASSGGESRVIRAIYGPQRCYVQMVQRAYRWWQELDAQTDQPLYVETGALWMLRGDDDAYIKSALPILAEYGFPVEHVDLALAKRRWPQIDWRGVRSAYFERKAGVLAARRACQVVCDLFVRRGGDYRIGEVLPGRTQNGRLQDVSVAGSRLAADAYVFACGPWLGQVFPTVIGDALLASRQEVFFWGTPSGSLAYAPPQLPVWIDFGERIFYGIPDIRGRGFKLADDTRGVRVDPSEVVRQPSPADLARARGVIAERFPGLVGAPLLESRVCQYENSPDGDLIVDRHPGIDNLWLVGGGSGHGYKLAPAVGEQVALAVVSGQTLPEKFAVARLSAIPRRSTQFEHR